jgi:hypothetical protein
MIISDSIKRFFRNISYKTTMLNRTRHMLISVELNKKIPRLVLHQKYKNIITWSIRILTIIGIISSILTLAWYNSLGLTIILLIIEQLLEKVIFVYHSLYIQAIPLDYKHSDWVAMLYGIPRNTGSKYILGMIFDSEKNAKKIFSCIESWNQRNDTDINNSINISFIIESETEYSVYIYPNADKKTLNKISEKASKNIKENERHQLLIMQIMFCKPFDYTPESNFIRFKEHYPADTPYTFGAYILENNNIKHVSETQIITKKDLKIKHRKDVSKTEPEYDHKRFIETISN